MFESLLPKGSNVRLFSFGREAWYRELVPTTHVTIAFDNDFVEKARRLGVDVLAVAREGAAAAVRQTLGEAERAAYLRFPEQSDDFWDEAQAWGDWDEAQA